MRAHHLQDYQENRQLNLNADDTEKFWKAVRIADSLTRNKKRRLRIKVKKSEKPEKSDKPNKKVTSKQEMREKSTVKEKNKSTSTPQKQQAR